MARKDKDKQRAYDREWQRAKRVKNREEVNRKQREYQRHYCDTHPEYRARHNLRTCKRNQEQKLQVLSHYSKGTPICAHCGITDVDVLSLDHINGGGRQHRKLNPHSYRWALKENYPEGFQVLCFNCNWKKRLLSKQINKGEN